MELPQAFQHFVHPKTEKKELFLSLLLDSDAVAVAVWEMGQKRQPIIIHAAVKDVGSDSWESRTTAADDAISSFDVGGNARLEKVVLGLPATYLTHTGDIHKDIRPHLRTLTHALGLAPMGFVSLYQAIIHSLKRDEGVPPTVILLGITAHTLTVSVYKIGSLVGQKIIEKTEDFVMPFEEALKSFQELEVLPSRILLYGTHAAHLEEVKAQLLRHPWQTRANFMHFPKIDVLSLDTLIAAISSAGASELALSMGPDELVEEKKVEPVEHPETIVPPEERHEQPNVVLVDPQHLGFRKNIDVVEEEPVRQSPQPKKILLPHISFPHILLPQVRIPRVGPMIAIAGILVVLIGGIGYWVIPHATVTLYEVPKKLTKTLSVSIDPTATVPDSTSKILPGKKQEKTVRGEKTVPVTGKKQVGDPARGAVKIYNKTFDVLNVPKGTIFTSGDLQFTLDTAVSVASASAVEFTTNTGSLTASAIGTKSNVPAGTIFSIKGYALSEAAAKNDQALAGGTSKDVTVVTRADQDALVKALTADLVDKAKQDLTGSVTGDDILIDGTIKTSVVDKSFIEELDQEAKELHGKATITVSGTSYRKSDLTTLLTGAMGDVIPAGYAFDPQYTNATLTDPQVKKDGKVSATAQLSGVATPQIDVTRIRGAIAGKTIAAAQEYLKTIGGIGAVAFRFQLSPLHRLPVNKNNISVTVAVGD